ncbi:hypothetical protein [Bifidobacterium cuniculi]|uniref:Uncharacterized protein n=1 Tax=Bifidobacterium cuniculi TaxID=1688 RepID=A0A087ADI9_9BIFI|nr:hypothetical protein [Bifidobacterium cuniculi]KFI56839.1 hypothetical protein BCUN_2161 [Bifidobacterium cuniculi]
MNDNPLSFSIASLDVDADAWSPNSIQARQINHTLAAWADAVERYGTSESMDEIHALLRGRILQYADTGPKTTTDGVSSTINKVFSQRAMHAADTVACLMLLEGPIGLRLSDVYAITTAVHHMLSPRTTLAWALEANPTDDYLRARLIIARAPTPEPTTANPAGAAHPCGSKRDHLA